MLKGNIDLLNDQWIIGWAVDESRPDAPVCLLVTDNDVVIGRILADQYRDDLAKAGIGSGHHGFEYKLQARLVAHHRHVLSLLNQADGAEVPGCPFVVEARPDLEDASGLNPPQVATAPATSAAAVEPPLRGNLDRLDIHGVEGWAWDKRDPDAPVSLVITNNDSFVGRVLANRYRVDLVEAGIGDGRHAFAFEFPVGLAPFETNVIKLCNESNGEVIPGSPFTLEPAPRFDEAVETLISRALSRCGGEEDIPRKIALLAREHDRLMQQLADRDSNRKQRARDRHFVQRWARRMEAEPVEKALDLPLSMKRALVIDDRLPRVDRDAGSNAIMSHARSLQRLGYEVVFVPAADFSLREIDRQEFEATGLECCCGPLYGSVEEVLRRQAGEFDIIYLHRIGNAAKYGELVRHYFPRAQRIFSVADLHHVRLARQAAIENRPEISEIAKSVRLHELMAAAFADIVITHSSFEAEILCRHVRPKKVHTIPWSVAVRPTRQPFAHRHDFAFIGGFGHQPNADAVRWLLSEIVPLARKLNEQIKCLLVGSEFPEELAKLHADGVVVVGQVDDLAEIFDRVRLTVAPLGFGAGVKGKVLDSLAAGVPCVCTPVAAEGLELPQELQPCVVDGAAKIAAAIHRLHDDEKRNNRFRDAGLEYVAAQLSERRIDSLMRAALQLPNA